MSLKPLVIFCALWLAACGASADGDPVQASDAGTAECIANATQCDGNSFMSCVNGHFEVTQQCTASICDPTFGCVECSPGQNFCDGDTVASCSDQGQRGADVETCTGDDHCSGGACRNLCAEAEAARSYLGCEYWAVDLDNAVQVQDVADSLFGCTLAELTTPGVKLFENMRVCQNGNALADQCDGDDGCPNGFTCVTRDVCALNADAAPFAIVVSNPHPFAVDVTLEDGSGMSVVSTIPASEVTSIYPANLGFADQSVTSTSVSRRSYRLRAEVPVVAYQFNPLDNEDVFSNDGSLLIPRHTFDTEYYAMTYQSLQRRTEPGNGRDFNGYVTVAAWQDGTEVTVTPTADVRASLTQPAIAAGTPTVFTLNAFEVLNLESSATGDLTGTHVQVTGGDMATIAVFSGHEAVSILSPGAQCCADHIEEMMLPTSTWGNEYAIARSQKRVNENDVLRIMAQVDGTMVTVNPAASCPTLNAGAFCEVEITGDVEVSANNPVLIGHYLKSVIGPDPANPFGSVGIGDPSMAIAVPVEQFRSSYDFLVPAEYNSQYISVVATMGAQVKLDGTDVGSQLVVMGGNGRGAARISVSPGQHDLTCTGGCGLELYGYSDAVSYLIAGGLDLEQIVVD